MINSWGQKLNWKYSYWIREAKYVKGQKCPLPFHNYVHIPLNLHQVIFWQEPFLKYFT